MLLLCYCLPTLVSATQVVHYPGDRRRLRVASLSHPLSESSPWVATVSPASPSSSPPPLPAALASSLDCCKRAAVSADSLSAASRAAASNRASSASPSSSESSSGWGGSGMNTASGPHTLWNTCLARRWQQPHAMARKGRVSVPPRRLLHKHGRTISTSWCIRTDASVGNSRKSASDTPSCCATGAVTTKRDGRSALGFASKLFCEHNTVQQRQPSGSIP